MVETKITWEEIGDYFNSHGSIYYTVTRGKFARIYIRFQEKDCEFLDRMVKFLRYGTVVKRKDTKIGGYVLDINEKAYLLDFLLNTRPHVKIRLAIIDFLLKNYNFNPAVKNLDFNSNELKRLQDQWKLQVRELKALLKREKELEGQLEKVGEEELEETEEEPVQDDESIERRQIDDGE